MQQKTKARLLTLFVWIGVFVVFFVYEYHKRAK
jgi:hypothetical protein